VEAKVTTGNVHDTQSVTELVQGLTYKLYADKGYLSKALATNLFEKGVTLVATVHKKHEGQSYIFMV
jgi:IS5 family transposase